MHCAGREVRVECYTKYFRGSVAKGWRDIVVIVWVIVGLISVRREKGKLGLLSRV